jgi:hypothetical protein
MTRGCYEHLFVAPADTNRWAPWTEVLLMNMLLAPLAAMILYGAGLLSAVLGSLAGGALVEVAVRRRLQPRPPTRRG